MPLIITYRKAFLSTINENYTSQRSHENRFPLRITFAYQDTPTIIRVIKTKPFTMANIDWFITALI